MNLQASYHNTTKPEKLMEIVDGTAAVLKQWLADRAADGQGPITHIVATGSSGQSVAWPVSYKLGIPVCIVRKPGEQSHAGLISGTGKLGCYVIIDDLIDSGASLRRVADAITEAAKTPAWGATEAEPSPARCIGVFLYQQRGDRAPVTLSGPNGPALVPVICSHYS